MKNQTSALESWVEVMTQGRDISPTEAAFAELSDYTGLPVEEVKAIASGSEMTSRRIWAESTHTDAEKVREIYAKASHTLFGILNFHARQAEGLYTPLAVEVAEAMSDTPPGDYLDFGAGVATAGLLFASRGWRVTIADISPPSLDFARWRYAKRGVDARFVNLDEEDLGTDAYDLITAYNVMAHIPQNKPTLRALRRALRPGGRLVFDIDVREPGLPGNHSFFYRRPDPFLRPIRRLGFLRRANIGSMFVYERAELSLMQRAWIAVIDQLRYNAVASWLANLVRRVRMFLKIRTRLRTLTQRGASHSTLPHRPQARDR